MISCGAVIQLTSRVEIIAEEELVHNLHHQGDDDGHVDNEGDDDWEDVDHVDCDICDDFVVLKA